MTDDLSPDDWSVRRKALSAFLSTHGARFYGLPDLSLGIIGSVPSSAKDLKEDLSEVEDRTGLEEPPNSTHTNTNTNSNTNNTHTRSHSHTHARTIVLRRQDWTVSSLSTLQHDGDGELHSEIVAFRAGLKMKWKLVQSDNWQLLGTEE